MPEMDETRTAQESQPEGSEARRSLERYWRTNLRIMAGLLLIWAIGGLGCGVLFADALTPLFPPPSEKIQKMIDLVREPEGEGPAMAIEAAPER